MGVVYLARHVTLGRRAAIKVLRPTLSSNQDIVSRFFKEARAATAVHNAGIVEVYDFGFLEDRTAYIIMEYLDGESLAARLRRGRLTIVTTLTIIRAIARALQAAHEQGIIHRDLKPDNVFLVPDSELPSGERVKLLDFGIAKLTHDASDASSTRTGTVMGTPTYMSPEQCRGAGQVDLRADLYSLGCVAYEMLCGRPPFIAEGPGDVIARHLCFEPVALRSYQPTIPIEIEEIVLRLLKKEPRERYHSAAELVHVIDQFTTTTQNTEPRSNQTASDFIATLPLVVEKTTLNGAASSSTTLGRERTSLPRRRVTGVVAGAVAATILVVIVLFVRSAHNEETDSGFAVSARPVETNRSEGPVAPAPGVVPSVSSAISSLDAGSLFSTYDAQLPVATSPGDRSAGNAVTPPNTTVTSHALRQ
jgi:serine/threonine protein kinase